MGHRTPWNLPLSASTRDAPHNANPTPQALNPPPQTLNRTAWLGVAERPSGGSGGGFGRGMGIGDVEVSNDLLPTDASIFSSSS